MDQEIPFRKEGIYARDNILYVIGPRHIAKVSKILASETRTKILEVLAEGPTDLDSLAKQIGQSKANISSQIRQLESIGIIRASYVPGNRGIKKILELNVDRILMAVKPGA
ncbi:MAG: ArsR family transcriptional regulator [Desulfurococcales archaeon]|nr:ArsR family transcriptional regulator [Desulfurococcales archaeon]